MNPFQSLHSYEEFLYTLMHQYPSIKRSSLILVKRGKRTAIVQGEIYFANGYQIKIRERISFDFDQIVIESYGYEIWHHEKVITWYDSQPHPNEPTLSNTFPHHKRIEPDIKHHRISEPNIHFYQANLPFLIRQIETLIKES